MLSEKLLAKLTNTLQVPLIVQDILDGEGILSPDVQYGLHEVISDYQPDSALLCIALSARKIASHHSCKSPNMVIMKMECDRIIGDYAEMWMRNAEDKTLNNNIVFDTLEAIPEDLECLAELLEINIGTLGMIDEDLSGLAEILVVQARAQALIADTFIEMLDTAPIPAQTMPQHCDTNAAIIAENDNVIAFPGTLRA